MQKGYCNPFERLKLYIEGDLIGEVVCRSASGVVAQMECQVEEEPQLLFRSDGRVAPPELWPLVEEYRAALKCQICGKLPVDATNTDCNHCFCRTCIDEALYVRSVCPKCNMPTFPASLRPYTMGARLVECLNTMMSFTTKADFAPLLNDTEVGVRVYKDSYELPSDDEMEAEKEPLKERDMNAHLAESTTSQRDDAVNSTLDKYV